MFILITFILLFLTISVVITLRLTRPGGSHTWLITVGVLLSWVSVLLWQFNIPWHFVPGQWMSAGLFNASPQLFASQTAWLYALSLVSLAGAVILTSAARSGHIGTSSWPETLVLAGLGLLAILADNPLGLALTWMAIDLAGFVLALRRNAKAGESIWFSFAIRLIAIACALWAGVIGTSASGQSFALEAAPVQAGIFLVIAAALRLLALSSSLSSEPDVYMAQRGFDTMLSSVSALTGLLVLARIPSEAIDSRWTLPLLILTALVALFNGWKWLFAPDELQGRRHWLIGMGALALAACLGNNPIGAAVWGICLVLFGGVSFLYSTKQVWITRILAAVSLLMLSLPYTLTAAGWLGSFPLPYVFLPLFVLAHILLVAGYLRHLFRPAETDFLQLPNWSQTTYTLGFALIVLSVLLGSLWGWPGALTLGNWIAALPVLPLTGAALFVSIKMPQLGVVKPFQIRLRRNRPLRFPSLLNIFVGIFSFFYRMIGNLTSYISELLEGDGGLLWTLLLLILLISFLREGR